MLFALFFLKYIYVYVSKQMIIKINNWPIRLCANGVAKMADLLQQFEKDDFFESSRSRQARLNPFDDEEVAVEAVRWGHHAMVQIRYPSRFL